MTGGSLFVRCPGAAATFVGVVAVILVDGQRPTGEPLLKTIVLESDFRSGSGNVEIHNGDETDDQESDHCPERELISRGIQAHEISSNEGMMLLPNLPKSSFPFLFIPNHTALWFKL
ncbi:hypothetical protein [Paenibacillus sp. GYB003]|uniref:hypothetical protein n=1 Tax=Paenibacillus sp. GYB003 TaxID=2994392 RepID=UPI002F96320F